jgi:hypothetical protein
MIIGYSALNDYLIEQLPELREKYTKFLIDWPDEAPGPHIVFEDVLCPWIDALLHNAEQNVELLTRTFNVVEALVKDGGLGIRNVVGVSVCEPLEASRSLDRARVHGASYCGTVQ